MNIDKLGTIRLFQLISPSLPTGAFSYSQGLEWAVSEGWVKDKDDFRRWLQGLLYHSLGTLEIPVLRNLYEAAWEKEIERFLSWRDFILASRETRELRQEEVNRGRAMSRLLRDMDMGIDDRWLEAANQSQLAGTGLAAAHFGIPVKALALGHGWSWLENLVMAGIKLIPLGHTVGQRLLLDMSKELEHQVSRGLGLENEEIGGSCPAMAIGSSLHETQYSRLFRS